MATSRGNQLAQDIRQKVEALKGEHNYRTDGRPIAQWSRLKAGYSDDLRTGRR